MLLIVEIEEPSMTSSATSWESYATSRRIPRSDSLVRLNAPVGAPDWITDACSGSINRGHLLDYVFIDQP